MDKWCVAQSTLGEDMPVIPCATTGGGSSVWTHGV